MGLRVSIYRSDYDSDLNLFHGKKHVTVTNIDGPFDPSPDAPAALLYRRAIGDFIGPDVNDLDSTHCGPMNGGTLAFAHDGRWDDAVGGYKALPIHDRYETWAQYDIMSR